MNFHWVTWVLLVWFALEALLFTLLPAQALQLLKNISSRELRVMGVIQLLIVAMLAVFLARAFAG